MSEREGERRSVEIDKLPSGVPGLDRILGGGIPEYAFNLIAGEPGAGKTTLAQQIIFENATPDRVALYFTILGEPTVKMLRYQQQFSFFDPDKVGESVRFSNLSRETVEEGLKGVLEKIIRDVEEIGPAFVVVDSFRSLIGATEASVPTQMDLQAFVQRLALHLTTWQVTSFLVGEYHEPAQSGNAVFTIADTILWLSQVPDNNSVVRKVQVVKVRGQAQLPGFHTFRITGDGLQVFPRLHRPLEGVARVEATGRASTGIEGLDEMMEGGIPAGDSVLVAGPSGSGKSVLAAQFIAEGGRQGEPGVLVVFEEHPDEYLSRATGLGLPLDAMVDEGRLEVIYLRPLDLSPDETLFEIREAVQRVEARRVVIDSMSGFELALAPTFRADFRESLYRLVGALTGLGITVLTTMEVTEGRLGPRFTPNMISFVADDLISLRYVEIDHELRKVMSVVKMRGSSHSKEYRQYEITDHGLVVNEGLEGYTGRISGAPRLTKNEE